jgi:hypothetical protein
MGQWSSGFFGRISKKNKFLTKLMKRKWKKMQIYQIGAKNGMLKQLTEDGGVVSSSRLPT